jgi:HD-GYP domain-containing protein (c-di-GMP phosphodiesterase class II)
MSVPASINRQCNDLSQLMGTVCVPCSLGKLDTDTVSRLDQTQIGIESVQLALTRSIAIGSSVYTTQIDHRVLFVVPIPNLAETDWFAVGTDNDGSVDGTSRLAQAGFEAMRRQLKLDQQDTTLLTVERELKQCFGERQWLGQLNSQGSSRSRSHNQLLSSLESLRKLIDAEAIAVIPFDDSLADRYGIQPVIAGTGTWSTDHVASILQRVQKPCIGDEVVLGSTVCKSCSVKPLYSCVVVPIGEREPIGYVVALNKLDSIAIRSSGYLSRFQSKDVELLHELASVMCSDGMVHLLFQESEQLVLGMLRTMSNAIEARDPYTHGHSERVARVAYEIAVELQLGEVACQEIYLAGILHDIGKIGIPDSVLLKPGRLEPEEFKIIQQHPEIGHRILEEFGKFRFALPGVLYHHERVDGTGYPHRLSWEQIPLMARILAVSDAYDAMTSSRVYRNAMGRDRATEILREGAGKQWDVETVDACLRVVVERELIRTDGSFDQKCHVIGKDWQQATQALRVLHL